MLIRGNCPPALFAAEDAVSRPTSAVFASLQPTAVFSVFWEFAAERQEIFWRRMLRQNPPWTQDPILASYKFTNAYRASDRVSQYLIRNVIYGGPQELEDVVFRVLLFKLFNKIETWELLQQALGTLLWATFSVEKYDRVLNQAFEAGQRIYSAAYIMPAASRRSPSPRKHRTHLELLEDMMKTGLPRNAAACRSLQSLFDLLRSYPSLGNFLAYQYAIDLNYSAVINFDESEFVVAGPGARGGIARCFAHRDGYSEAQIIRLVADHQDAEFELRGLRFRALGQRPLQLIDIQNLFCEIDKYARVRFPEAAAGRTRIKQRFHAHSTAIRYWYPPKWGIDDAIAAAARAPQPGSDFIAAD
jgi:hypothetical protein